MPSSRDILRRLIEAIPEAAVEVIDGPLTHRKAMKEVYREAGQFADQVRVPSKWYATDGTGQFYFFRKKALGFSNEWFAFERQPVTIFGTSADQAYRRHNGQLTDRRPAGWVSAATFAAGNFTGLEGSPNTRGISPQAEDLDYDPAMAERIWRENRSDRDAYLAANFNPAMDRYMQSVKKHARL
jgi:hypothetical protein